MGTVIGKKEKSISERLNVPILTVLILKDGKSYMAKCVELDLVTEMDNPEKALKAIVEMIREYAQDYKKREELFAKSPNRAHHKPYIDEIIKCKDLWEIYELIKVQYGYLHV
jgi:hypothetical protein